MPDQPDHLAAFDSAVDQLRAAPLLDKVPAAEAALVALRAVLAAQQRELAAVRDALADHQRRGH